MCIDGSAGEYHIDQSLDKIVIRSSTSETLTEGSQVTIIATVYPVSSDDGTLSYDYADFSYANDASNPKWIYIGTESPNPAIKSAQNLHMTYILFPRAPLRPFVSTFDSLAAGEPIKAALVDPMTTQMILSSL
jgi:hypothetical protein